MSSRCSAVESVGEIRLEPRPAGVRAVYLVETRNRAESREIEELFRELESRVQVRRLSTGMLTGYAVQARQSDAAIVDAIEDVLRESFACVTVQRELDEVTFRVLADLCRRTGSRMLSMERCAICGKPAPFPAATVTVSDGRKSPAASRGYCAHCTAEASRPTNQAFVRSLLSADRDGLSRLGEAQIERRRSRGGIIRFGITTRSCRDHCHSERSEESRPDSSLRSE